MPGDDGGATEAADFLTHVQTTFPDTATHWVAFDSESDFLDIIRESDYSRDPTDDRPAFSAGIVFTSGSPDWAYTVRACVRVWGEVVENDATVWFQEQWLASGLYVGLRPVVRAAVATVHTHLFKADCWPFLYPRGRQDSAAFPSPLFFPSVHGLAGWGWMEKLYHWGWI